MAVSDHNDTPPMENMKDVKLHSTAVDVGLTVSLGEGTAVANVHEDYKVYKRRFIGWSLLTIMSILATWSWILFAPVSPYVAEYFNTSLATVNWFSTGWLFAYLAGDLPASYAMRRGSKFSLMMGASLTFPGIWLRYGGSHIGNIGLCMFGQMICGFSAPFILNLPVLYSNEWFSPRTRVSATTIPSMANVFGGFLAGFVQPAWVQAPADLTKALLYFAIIQSAFSLAVFFIPRVPPSPPSPAVVVPDIKVKEEFRWTFRSPEAMIIIISFCLTCGVFNSFSTLYFQILLPYGVSAGTAGVGSALLAATGLGSALILGPLADITKKHLLIMKACSSLLAILNIVFIFVPGTQNVGLCYGITALISLFQTGSLPVVLEFLVEIHYPHGCEVPVSLMWGGGNTLGTSNMLYLIAFSLQYS